ncbi:MAG: Ig-like domain-containing protein [Caldilineaceae bacterium]
MMNRWHSWLGLAVLLLTVTSILSFARMTHATSVQAGTLCGSLSGAVMLTLQESPYTVTCGVTVGAGASLTIPPGVTLRFGSEGGSANLFVSDGGTLIAEGTAVQPIIFTSVAATPHAGDWQGITIGTGGVAQFAYCEIGDAGRNALPALRLDSSAVQVRHCRIHHNQADGIFLFSFGITPLIEDSTLDHNGGIAIEQISANMAPIYRRLTASANGTDAVQMAGGFFTGDRSWHFGEAGIPILVDGSLQIPTGVALELEPGSELRFLANSDVSVSGSLFALGSPTRPITFTAQPQHPGVWQGLEVITGGSAILRYCNIAYAGQFGTANVRITTDDVVLQGCKIHDGAGDGIQVSSEHPALRQNQIYANAGLGLRNPTLLYEVDVRDNWWGHASGPFHATLNPTGQGNGVSDGVIFDPWSTAPTSELVLPETVVVQLDGPAVANQGETVDYRIAYANLTGQKLTNAVLLVALPGHVEYLEHTGPGIYWAERQVIFWKFATLASDATGVVTFRLRYQSGLPDNLIDHLLVLVGATDWANSPFNVQPYLTYTPVTVTSRQALGQAELLSEQQTSPQFAQIFQRTGQAGYQFNDLSRFTLSSGEVVTQALLTILDQGQASLIQHSGNTVLETRAGRDTYALNVVNGGMTVPLSTMTPQYWGAWQPAPLQVAGVTGLGTGSCVYNCLNEKSKDWIFGEFTDKIDKLSAGLTCKSCAASADPLSAECKACAEQIVNEIPGVEQTIGIKRCTEECASDPDTHLCTDDVISCEYDPIQVGLEDRGVNSYTRFFCDRATGQLSRGVCYCDQGYACHRDFGCAKCNVGQNEGDGGPWPTLQRVNAATVVSDIPACPSDARAVTVDGECDEDDTRIRRAKDPNAKYGPLGDLLPEALVSYTVTYANEGSGVAYGVFIVDPLDQNLDENTLNIDGNGKYFAASRQIIWSIGEVAAKGDPGAQGSVSFTAKLKANLPSNTVIINRATIYFPSVPETTPTNPVVNLIQPLVAVPQHLTTNAGQPLAIQLQGKDAANKSLTFAIVDPPVNGTLSGTAPALTYTPAPNFSGEDFFGFRVSNGISQSKPVAVQITVNPAASDTTPPQVLWTSPANLAEFVPVLASPLLTDTNGALYGPAIRIRFSEALDPATVSNAVVQLQNVAGQSIPLDVTYEGTSDQLIILTRQALQPNTQYKVTLQQTLKDASGNSLASAYTWRFATGQGLRDLYLPLLHR